MKRPLIAVLIAIPLAAGAGAQEEHHHSAPEHLGAAHLATSCSPAEATAFNRANALLHSFSYNDANAGFADVALRDFRCAMAHWGRAMTYYHQLWDVPVGAGLAAGINEIGLAEKIGAGTLRERAPIAALGIYYADVDRIPANARAIRYSHAMANVHATTRPTTRSRHSMPYH